MKRKILVQKSITLVTVQSNGGRFDLSDLGPIRLTNADLKPYRLNYGDILVYEGGDVGRSAIWKSGIPESYFQKALHKLHPRK